MSAAEVTKIRPGLDVLRQPFDPKVVGKLPRVTCKDCSNRNCKTHRPAKCQECGGYLTTQHIHLDYVGHAEVTDRLLSADPAWNWEPLAWTEEGMPKFTKGSSGELELWIRLTVCGVTRLGVGSVSGNAFDAEKQLIGDALRNAAMRFGVALDLWAKEELESQLPSEDDAKTRRSKPAGGSERPRTARDAIVMADEHGTPAPAQQHVAHTRPPEMARVVDTAPLPEEPPSTGTRKRRPPTAAAEPMVLASEEDRDAIATILKRYATNPPAREALMKRWADAKIQSFKAVERFTSEDAAKALDLLAEFQTTWTDEQPTLDGDAS